MTTQTFSPSDTGEIRRTFDEQPTQALNAYTDLPVLRRADAMPNSVVDTLPRTIGIVPDLTHPDTMPLPPPLPVPSGPQPKAFEPDSNPAPKPYPAPVPAGPHPRRGKALVPTLRPSVPGELYADSRARRGLPELVRKPRGYVGHHRKASR